MKGILRFLLLIILASCTSNTIYKKPDNLIPKDTMMMLLEDLYIANSAKTYKNINLQITDDYNQLVFQKYKIDSTRFEQSNIYYTSRIEDYQEMIKDVKKQLKIKETELNSQIKREDSIKKSKIPKRKRIDTLQLKKQFTNELNKRPQ